jgi:hypothetical protein
MSIHVLKRKADARKKLTMQNQYAGKWALNMTNRGVVRSNPVMGKVDKNRCCPGVNSTREPSISQSYHNYHRRSLGGLGRLASRVSIRKTDGSTTTDHMVTHKRAPEVGQSHYIEDKKHKVNQCYHYEVQCDPPKKAIAVSVLADDGTTTEGVSNGTYKVDSITVTNQGLGYSSAPDIIIDAPPSGGTQATATATINSDGQVSAITMDDKGSGYTSVPNVTIKTKFPNVYKKSRPAGSNFLPSYLEPDCHNNCGKGRAHITKNLGFMSSSEYLHKKLSNRKMENGNYESPLMNSASCTVIE